FQRFFNFGSGPGGEWFECVDCRVQDRPATFSEVFLSGRRVDREVRGRGEQESEQIPGVGEYDYSGLNEFGGFGEYFFVDFFTDISVPDEVFAQPSSEIGGSEHPDMFGVDRVGFFLVEAGRVRVDFGDVEGGDHLVQGEHIVVVGDAPAEECEVIQQTFGYEA